MSELEAPDWPLSFGKDVTDVVGAAVVLPLFVPLAAATALKIRQIDGMSPFFTQTRYGRNLEPFSAFKLRTMPPEIEEAPSLGKPLSTRTDLGFELSESHIDEIPQVFNIFLRQMSLAGGIRPLIKEDIDNTLDVLTEPDERKTFLWAMANQRPSMSAEFGLNQFGVGFQFDSEEDYIRARARGAVDYLTHPASFEYDMDIIYRTVRAAVSALVVPEEVSTDGIRRENMSKMLARVAEGFGVKLTDEERAWFRANLIAIRVLDDLVDDQGISDLSSHVKDIQAGKPVDGMTDAEAAFFADSFGAQSDQLRDEMAAGYLSLPKFAQKRFAARTARELIAAQGAEGQEFGLALALNPSDQARAAFNKWLINFGRVGCLADLVIDSEDDYRSGRINFHPSKLQKLKITIAAAAESRKLLTTPARSYPGIGKTAIRTLLRR